MSNDQAGSQSGLIDPIDSMIDFSEYDNISYQSPALSPAGNKAVFARPTTTATTSGSLLSTSQPLNPPSHQYDRYKQQTGIVPGALANTFAVNQNNSQITGYSSFNIDAYLGMSNTEDMFDFNTNPSQNSLSTPDMDMDFESPTNDPNFFFGETVNPNVIGGQENGNLPSPPVMPSQAGNVGRVWPGMHQQAALAKAQAQQRQQQQIIQQQQHQQQQRQSPPKQQHRAKAAPPSDPIVEQKITQLLNSMRAKPASPDESQSSPSMNITRAKKEEEDMDEDERLLASEEGKKLSSKERRQLRNKVSARAFRSRRKEYISQLEAEIAGKVTENGDLKAQNRALQEENKRLADLTRMLLSSPSFSDFLERMTPNAGHVPQPAPQVEQRQESRQVPKDVNPYVGQQQTQHQNIGMAMIPEQTMDFSMLSLDTDSAFSFQPQVYAVLETPEISIDTSVLSGKTSNFVGSCDDEEKVEMPIIEHPVEDKKRTEVVAPTIVDDEFESDPTFALYHDVPKSVAERVEEPREIDTDAFSHVDIFGGIEPEKALARYDLVDATEEKVREAEASLVLARVERIAANLDIIATRLGMLSFD